MKTVVIGISGGVDSSVAAYLLKKEGYKVIGITFIFTEDFDVNDAILTCKKLEIEHHILDYKDIFKKEVINKFINEFDKAMSKEIKNIIKKTSEEKLL